ncbi:hypothetical protein [Pontiella sulfatireligans]|uniref:STAS/SEC14 domain-containing protein n=1 Tax=Pontiella sulfatireligans TaxID=2750658 RepID=A0A6C2UVE7_9BACT|nr:hypothetical protein [Pontiella sulfatireligans]VGO23371.1 hypothetical protein SCARR_05478 [Pontiella sulfatireligans]
MAIELRFSNRNSRVDIVCTGLLSSKEARSMPDKAFAPETLPKLKKVVVDYLCVEHFGLALQDLEYMAKKTVVAAEKRKGIVIAIIATRLLAIRLTRMWQAFARNADVEIEIFDSCENAETWLALR